MKGKENVLKTLNALLADELTAINQYILHSEMCANWGYERLHEAIEKRAIEEMKHAEKLIARILFLEGMPVVSQLNPMHIGATVQEMLEKDHQAEAEAISAYNQAVRLCVEEGDNGSRTLLEGILSDEENHIDWLEAQMDQIRQMGLENYLSQQLED
ncbi:MULTISPECIES: bacterioferritin [Anaerolinea]|uniref:bacterioferritin n=1 Tax=Anaerolinea TaxID=233189 RepID=UPI00261D5831|nr:bacterioferritin [Anaerolinea thermophila]